MAVAEEVGKRSLCDKAQIGCVVVSALNRIEATGYNGPPAGFSVSTGCSDWCPRKKYGHDDAGYETCFSVHAEINALMYVDRSRVEGGTLYCTGSLCIGCAKAVANSGVARVVMKVVPGYEFRNPEKVADFVRACGLTVDVVGEA
jgi:dCMP deaminase